MKKIILVVCLLTAALSVSAQNTIFYHQKDELASTRVILPAYFTPVVQWEIQELGPKSTAIMPKVPPKFQLEIPKNDSILLPHNRLQSLFYRMKTWYYFQHKSKKS